MWQKLNTKNVELERELSLRKEQLQEAIGAVIGLKLTIAELKAHAFCLAS